MTPRQEPIRFSVTTSSTAAVEASPVDWRLELRRKLQKHAKAKGITPKGDEDRFKRPAKKKTPDRSPLGAGVEPSQAPVKPEETDAKPETAAGAAPKIEAPGEVVRELFKYRLEDVDEGSDKPKIVTFAKARPQPGPLDRPLIRKPVKPSTLGKAAESPEQKNLDLESPAVAVPPSPASEIATPAAPPLGPRLESISSEILLSRFLAFIIDLSLSVAVGFLFVFLSSRVTGSTFPTADSLLLVASCGLVFLVLSSMFFLFATGQTWGMVCTDLRLQAEDGGPPSLAAVLARTVLFFAVLITIVGLALSLFDPLRRCWHDRLTDTLVVPSSASI